MLVCFGCHSHPSNTGCLTMTLFPHCNFSGFSTYKLRVLSALVTICPMAINCISVQHIITTSSIRHTLTMQCYCNFVPLSLTLLILWLWERCVLLSSHDSPLCFQCLGMIVDAACIKKCSNMAMILDTLLPVLHQHVSYLLGYLVN